MADSATTDAADPLDGAGFDALYENKIKPQLEQLEVKRRKAWPLFFLALAVGAGLCGVEALATSMLTDGRTSIPDIRILVLTLGIAGVVGYIPLSRVAKEAKVDVIRALCTPLGIDYAVARFEPTLFDTFLDLKLLPRPSGKSFQDQFKGLRSGRSFEFCEATLEQGSGKSRHVAFQGQIFRIELPKKRQSVTVLARDSGWLDRFECPAGLKKVGLEDPVFEKTFEVFGSDQVESREILTPTYMEHLLSLERDYAGKHIRCAFDYGDLLIALESPNRFEIGSMTGTLVNRDRVAGIARDISTVFRLMDSLFDDPQTRRA